MEEEYHLDLNSNELCRICLTRNCQLKTLFRCDIIDGEILRIPKVYKNITNIAVSLHQHYIFTLSLISFENHILDM